MWYNTRVVNQKEAAATVLVTPLQPMPKPDKEVRTMLYSTPVFPQDLENYAPWVATHGLVAPYGTCQCGCSELAPLANRNRNEHGWLKGEPCRYIKRHRPLGRPVEVRFWEKVNKNGPIHPLLGTACWEWTASKCDGYGTFSVKGKIVRTHKLSWQFANGEIPDGLFVCHHCDNPSCVRPDHLFLGDNRANILDAFRKGRLFDIATAGANSRKNIRFCAKGHLLEGDNVCVAPNGRRRCRICRNRSARERQAKSLEAIKAKRQAAAYAQVLDEHEAALARARLRRGSAPTRLVGGEGAL